MPEKQKQPDRARIVCMHCHARKVRCDLGDQTSEVCSNCKRRRQVCRRRGRRSYGTRSHSLFPGHFEPSLLPSNDDHNARSKDHGQLHSPESWNQDLQDVYQATKISCEPQAFVGEESFMTPLTSMQVNFVPETVVPEGVGTLRSQLSRDILHAANATLLPPKAQIQAFADSYFQHLYHRAPIVDHEDLAVEEPSILLTQVICLIGSLLRHPGIQSTVEESEQYYNKVKALLYTNYERDPRLVLKALCLLGFRNITPPKVISLDCSWHWIGMAARLAYQIGLHRESTYSQLKNPGNARRIMWFLFVEDKLQTACFGRPSILEGAGFDVQLPTLEDFRCTNLQAEIFIEYTKLNIILGGMVDLDSRKSEVLQEESLSILRSLQQWISNIPPRLRLYGGLDRSPFKRDVYEMHINYFVCLIVFFRMFGHSLPTLTTSTASLVAASCITRLYEEILYRDEVNYLMPINNWFLMVGCAPQIQHNAACQGKDQLCGEELSILKTSLRHMRLKWPPAGVLLDIIDRICNNAAETSPSSTDVIEGLENPHFAKEPTYHLPHSDLLNALFPFPGSFSPRLSLIQETNDSSDQTVLERMAELDDLNWIFDEYHLGYLDPRSFDKNS